MKLNDLHLDRLRARSFGSIAERYDRYRLGYPDALMDDLAATSASSVLDVACGTGKAAVALVRRGMSVLGVDIDERMAEIARHYGIHVEVAPFESWDDAGRSYDLITCAEAWHWMDPDLGIAKAARILRPGGAIALFWNSCEVDERMTAALEAVYEEHAPEVYQVWRPQPIPGSARSQLEDNVAFGKVEDRRYQVERDLTVDEWTGMASTIGDHIRLGDDRLTALLEAQRIAIESLGGRVRVRTETILLFSRRRPDGDH